MFVGEAKNVDSLNLFEINSRKPSRSQKKNVDSLNSFGINSQKPFKVQRPSRWKNSDRKPRFCKIGSQKCCILLFERKLYGDTTYERIICQIESVLNQIKRALLLNDSLKRIFLFMAIINHFWSFFYFTFYFYFFPFSILVILNIFSEDKLEY